MECPRCGREPAPVVEVHGHTQCLNCGSNIDECCRGEVALLNSMPAFELPQPNSGSEPQ
jgi:hypothetical protein